LRLPVPLSVLALSRYSALGASSRQRILLYCDSLKDFGVDVTVSEFFDDTYLLARYGGRRTWRAAARAFARRFHRIASLGRYDLIWIEKEMLPYLPASLENLFLRDIPYVIDIDDAWFFLYRNHDWPIVRRLLGMKFEQLVGHSAMTLVGNDYLGAWAKSSGARAVRLVPTVVDVDRYPTRDVGEGPFTIGWIGTPMTVRYLEHIAEPLRQICDGKKARLRIIGDTEFRISGVVSISHKWSEIAEADLISQCHIGIMPLPDDPWIHGKCGYKIIQFLGASRAVVATPTEANLAILGNGKAGFLAATNEEWMGALTRLREEPRLREEMGAAGRQQVQETYCLKATAAQLGRDLFAAAGKTAPAIKPMVYPASVLSVDEPLGEQHSRDGSG
jgi:glycosyltransferase involved in cell wall biosynthesis